MRTEKEMMELIIGVAQNDTHIRAAYMSGSRTNPNAPTDKYQDYDIVYVVTQLQSFIDDTSWLSVFGEALLIQEPDKNNMAFGEISKTAQSYGWLILLDDFNRIDLHIELKETAIKNICADSLVKLILDKDDFLPEIQKSTDSGYYVKRPTEEQFLSCCNNFWWCLQNVAKGIAREQLPYAMMMYNRVVRDELHKILDWYIGFQTDFSVSVGMWGKYYSKYLSSDIYAEYVKTYSDGDYQHMWTSIFAACALFSKIAVKVACNLNCTYMQDEEDGMMIYLRAVKNDTV